MNYKYYSRQLAITTLKQFILITHQCIVLNLGINFLFSDCGVMYTAAHNHFNFHSFIITHSYPILFSIIIQK